MPEHECGHVMLSGLKCVMPAGHEGHHFDGFGLRDPQPATPTENP